MRRIIIQTAQRWRIHEQNGKEKKWGKRGKTIDNEAHYGYGLGSEVWVHERGYEHLDVFVCVCIYVCMYVCMYVCIWVHARGYEHLYVFVCVFI